MVLHNQKYRNMFFFSNHKVLPIQNRIIYKHHATLLYFMVLNLYEQYRFRGDIELQMQFILFF